MKTSPIAMTIVRAKFALVAGLLVIGLPSVGFQSGWAKSASAPLPAWLDKEIAEREASKSHDVIEESTYQGRRVFEIISGDRFDTGDEHALFSETRKKLCVFGGFVGHVTWGSCDIAKITYVRTIFPAVCNIISRAERLKHIGETITIAGEFRSDIERALIWPDGCAWGVGVGKISGDVEKAIDVIQGHPSITVHGTFTGTLTQGRPNGFEFYKDDGTRLDVIKLTHPSPGKRKPK